MTALTNLIIFLLILGTAVFIHELGHFITAIRLGVHVEEFGLGLPPKMLTLGHWRGTAITLNWIPIGGFVRPEGEFNPDQPTGLAASPPRTRFTVLLAGVISNLLFAFVLLTGAFLIGGPAEGQIRVVEVSSGLPAGEAGLMSGDLIVRVEGKPATTAAELRTAIEAHVGQEMTLGVLRGGQQMEISFTPRTKWPTGEGPAGFTTSVEIVRYGFFESIGKSAQVVWTILRDTILTLAYTISGGGGAFRIVGPVGLKQASDWTIEQAAQWNALYPVLYLAGLINVGLGFTNLLPLPALDGGRIVFVLVEVLRGKRLPWKVERWVHGAGAIALIVSMIILSIFDLLNPLF
jgi:regulator of sigma E protease